MFPRALDSIHQMKNLLITTLEKKVASKRIDLDVIKDVDLYRIEPWDLQELCKLGTEDQNEWYFFSHKDKKYPTGTRTNRATKAGFWKATGRDKAIYSRHSLIGMRKTLVFYKGRAPNGQKLDWIMHEYRLETNENGTPEEEGWVVCRVFKKRVPTMRKVGRLRLTELELELQYNMPHDPFLQLPQLESPEVPQMQQCHQQNLNSLYRNNNCEQAVDQVTDWRVLDKFVASQLASHEDASKGTSNFSNTATFNAAEQMNVLANESKGSEIAQEYASTSTSSCQIDQLWK
ncbi:putative proteinC DOMAIN-CONTAINING PROTEIN 7-LIKE [Salix purpurea]|uniref:NAC domain-containing protein n=1 Tax=Salix purpurea TaxID=77065 RepID=A0A9Q0YW42_SALPP|nr:putative proteinC DOMAIN-CONTAINING PROTEIN 7-LIKE [Salix purpurea]